MTQILTNLQLRAARQVLNIGVRDIAKRLKTSKSTISKAEQGKTRDFFFKYSPALIDFFKKNNILFVNNYTISLALPIEVNSYSYKSIKLTRFQLKSARCILNLTQLNFSKLVGVDKGIISRAELLDNIQFINPSDKTVINKIKEAFTEQNIEFPTPHSIFFKNI
jgi:transcriptional regulator with XRE-family HTH domain